jgi:hypothetical protein
MVTNNFIKYNVLSENIRFVKGWFCDTMPKLSIGKIAMLRLDGDMYSSTWDVLENLYHKLSIGGYLIIDDFALNGCRKAIEDFRLKYGIYDEIKAIDKMGSYWIKKTEKKSLIEIDVCFVSNASTDELRRTTEMAIQTLMSSEKYIKFNVFVVESNKEVNYNQFENTKTIYTDLPFGYHRYLNLAIKEGGSDYVVLCNNDVTFNSNWASEILRGMDLDKDILSASPICPQVHNVNDYKGYLVWYGHEVRQQVTGWCIFQKRKIYNIIGKLDENFEFWFCDNDYAMDIKSKGIKHALISSSVVNHHNNKIGKTGEMKSLEERESMTIGQSDKFKTKWEWLLK